MVTESEGWKGIIMQQDEENLENESINDNKKNMVREVIDFIVYIAAIAIVCYLFITFIGQRTVVSGTSMIPTLQDNDNLITDKI